MGRHECSGMAPKKAPEQVAVLTNEALCAALAGQEPAERLLALSTLLQEPNPPPPTVGGVGHWHRGSSPDLFQIYASIAMHAALACKRLNALN